MLLSAVQQNESATHKHIAPLFWIFFPHFPILSGHHRTFKLTVLSFINTTSSTDDDFPLFTSCRSLAVIKLRAI